jgi:hypothetical protein
MQSVNPRLQLLGSGGFSPRFPSIPPALVLYGFGPNVPSRFSQNSVLEKFLGPFTAKLLRMRSASTKVRSVPPSDADPRLVNYTGNRHRPPCEVDSNRGELCRSPGSRFIRAKLPSQRISRQWLACFAPRRLQWRGRAGIAPASLTIQSLQCYTAAC